MNLLLLLTILIGFSTCATLRKSTENGRVNDKIDREIMEALKSIHETKNTIETSKNISNASEDTSFKGEMKWFFNSMLNAVRDVNVPFFHTKSGNETKSTHTVADNSSKIHDFMEKTREEMAHEVKMLREYYFDIRAEFDEWVISNKHQNFKSMLIGGGSAVVVLILYSIFVKCCRRRTRAHLSSFANDGSSRRNGDNQYLLGEEPTIVKHNRRYPSNSDEDI